MISTPPITPADPSPHHLVCNVRQLKKRDETQNWTGEPVASVSFTSAADRTRWEEYTRCGETPGSIFLAPRTLLAILGLAILLITTISGIFNLVHDSLEAALKSGGQILVIGLGLIPFVYYTNSAKEAMTSTHSEYTIIVRMTEGGTDTTNEENLNTAELVPMGYSAEEGDSYPPTYARFTDALIINSSIISLNSVVSIDLNAPENEEPYLQVNTRFKSLLFPLPSSCNGTEANTIMAPFFYYREEGDP